MYNQRKDFLISEFWRWVENHNGKIPKREDMKNKDGYPNNKAYTDFLGISDRKWQDVLDFVGAKRERVFVRHEYKYDNLTKEDFIEIIKKRFNELGRTLKQEDFGLKYNLPSASCIIDKLGLNKWNEVLIECGVGYAKERYYNKDKALKKLKDLIGNLGYTPTKRELQKMNFQPSMTWFTKIFGSYEETLKQIGINIKYTNKELLDILIRFYNNTGKSPTSKDMKNSNGLPSVEIYYKRFNTYSWNEILNLAGLNPNHIQIYNEDFALEKLREYYNCLGRIPKQSDFKDNNWNPSNDWYSRRYNSIENACYIAGLVNKPLTDEEKINITINELVKLANIIERCPTVYEFENIIHDGFERRTLERKLNLKYNSICRKYIPQYNLNLNRDLTKDEIKNNIMNVYNKLGRAPMYSELKEYNIGYSIHMMQRIFDNLKYNDIIKSFGLKPTGTTTVKKTEEQLLNEFYELFKKLGRIPYCSDMDGKDYISSSPTYFKYFKSIKNVCDMLDIDYELYYSNQSAGKIVIDINGGLCRSIIERDISNFFIINNIKFDKDPRYSEVIPQDKRIFDWKIYFNNKIYYIEYFGLYSRNARGILGKKYLIKTKKKIKDLYLKTKINTIFIFPYDIKHKNLKNIFDNILDDNFINYEYSTDFYGIEYGVLSDKELLDNIMKYSDNDNVLPCTKIISKKISGIYGETLKRYGNINNFALKMGKQTFMEYKKSM